MPARWSSGRAVPSRAPTSTAVAGTYNGGTTVTGGGALDVAATNAAGAGDITLDNGELIGSAGIASDINFVGSQGTVAGTTGNTLTLDGALSFTGAGPTTLNIGDATNTGTVALTTDLALDANTVGGARRPPILRSPLMARSRLPAAQSTSTTQPTSTALSPSARRRHHPYRHRGLRPGPDRHRRKILQRSQSGPNHRSQYRAGRFRRRPDRQPLRSLGQRQQPEQAESAWRQHARIRLLRRCGQQQAFPDLVGHHRPDRHRQSHRRLGPDRPD